MPFEAQIVKILHSSGEVKKKIDRERVLHLDKGLSRSCQISTRLAPQFVGETSKRFK